MQGLIGIVVVLAIAWLLSEDKRNVRLLPIAATLVAQFVVAITLLRIPIINEYLQSLNHLVAAVQQATLQGTSFVFDFLGGSDAPFLKKDDSELVIFAFRILPQILVFSVLVAILWHWRVLPNIIKGFAWVLRKTLGIGGAVGLAAASSIFVGMVEAPMVIRAYLKNLSRSEFFVVITCSMSTVAGSVMVLYTLILGPIMTDAIGHILTASLINVLGAILIARIMVPGTQVTESGDISADLSYDSTMDALTKGTSDGILLVVNVCAMLVVLVSLVALVDYILTHFSLFGFDLHVYGEPLTLSRLMGWIFAPITWCMGVPWVDVQSAGSLLGMKVILNELIAFKHLSEIGLSLQPDTRIIMTYAICGFTNLGSLGILIGGLSALVPDRRQDLLTLGPRTLISGTLVAILTGTIAGIVISV